MTDQTSIAPGQLWRHKKRGKVYAILSTKAKMQCSSNADIEAWFEGQDIVAYMNILDFNDVWLRPLLEFTDGRFEPLIGTKWRHKKTTTIVTIESTDDGICHKTVKTGSVWYLGPSEFFDRYERVPDEREPESI